MVVCMDLGAMSMRAPQRLHRGYSILRALDGFDQVSPGSARAL